MAPSLISLDDAAKQLNITAAELNERRERQEIYGYRDGASWKFKQADIDKLKTAMAGGGDSDDDLGLDDLALDDSDDLMDVSSDADSGLASVADSGEIEADAPSDDDSMDVMLLSEAELGESVPGASSTIIGKPGLQGPGESDIKIITDEDRAATGGAATPGTPGSDVNLAAIDDESSVLDVAGSDLALSASESDQLSPGSGISLTDEAAASAGEFSLDDDDDASAGFDLADDSSASEGFDLSEDSSDELSVMGDDEMVLGGSGVGSDITLGAADSGISLANPADSGLSLEEPFDLTDS
ncbi:MAG: helix-turn-helix domain-containing protein, partial [Planctomycetales bacterium]|nr:helix-turn-helix domain-containing protein [Planctomycetales bacterium]